MGVVKVNCIVYVPPGVADWLNTTYICSVIVDCPPVPTFPVMVIGENETSPTPPPPLAAIAIGVMVKLVIIDSEFCTMRFVSTELPGTGCASDASRLGVSITMPPVADTVPNTKVSCAVDVLGYAGDESWKAKT